MVMAYVITLKEGIRPSPDSLSFHLPLLSRRGQGWSDPPPYIAIGPYPIQLVVPIAVRNAVSAATITFTASSTILCFFILYLLSAL